MFRRMTELRVGVVDVYVIRRSAAGLEVLAMQRAAGTRCATAWEVVHGRIEEGERPEAAAIREVHEETGLEVDRLYNVTCQAFYLHRSGTVQVAVVFAALIDAPEAVTLGPEHERCEWVALDVAARRLAWPREREALPHIAILLAGGDAGPVEDVLRVV